jgi:hypothetical protein
MPSRLKVKPVFTGSYDQRAVQEYMHNHKLNPRRFPLPKQREPEPDTGPRSEVWAEAVSGTDKARLQAMDMRVKNEKPPKTFGECMAVPGISTDSEPQECIDPGSKRRFVEGEEGFYVGSKHYRPKRVRFADHTQTQEQDQVQAQVQEQSPSSMNMMQQVKHDLTGTWNDLKNFNTLPAESSMDKFRYTFTRENRTWSVVACIGVFILLVCLVGGLVYWAQSPSSSSSVSASTMPSIAGGFAPMGRAGWNGHMNHSYPLIE